MPRVPILTPRVETAPLPGTKLSPDAPAAAFQPAAPIDLSGAERFVQEERAKADQVAVLDADNQLSALSTQLRTTALQRQGKDALGASADVSQAFQTQSSAIEGTLTNDRQKLQYRERAMARFASLRETVELHAASEAQKYDDETTQAALANRLNDALANYQDPAQVTGSIAEQQAILKDQARRNGSPPEQLQQQLATWTSRTHTAVIDRMLSNGQDLAAKEYYGSVKDKLVGADTLNVEKALEEGSSRGESQRQADTITSAAATLSDALQKTREIQDPKVRDLTESRVRQFYAEQAESQRQQREAMMLKGTNLIESTHSFASLPPTLVAQLSVGERESLRTYAEKLTQGVPVKTNMSTWYTLRTLASSDATRDEFLKTNLLQYKGQLSDADFKELAGVQASLRKGDQTEQDKLASWNVGRGQILSSLASIGIVPSEKDKGSIARVADFTRQVQDQESAFIQKYGKKPSIEERQSIIDGLLTHGIVTKTGVLWDSQQDKRVFELQPGDHLVIRASDVPPSERAQIVQALQLQGLPVTDAAIVQKYRDRLAKMVPLGVPGAR